jgi:hypothetical protein
MLVKPLIRVHITGMEYDSYFLWGKQNIKWNYDFQIYFGPKLMKHLVISTDFFLTFRCC